MKILYAAGNRHGSFFQLKRFIQSISSKKITLKTAAYRKSLGNLFCDYTLDSLLNFSNPLSESITFNGNYSYYANEIKRFAPDLIISDVEIFTSIIAIENKIPIWQVSPILLWKAVTDKKYFKELNKTNYSLFNKSKNNKYYNFIIGNSDRRLVVSHLCDTDNPLPIDNSFSYVRPDFILSDKNSLIEYEYLSCFNNSNINLFDKLSASRDIIFFTRDYKKYDNIFNNLYDEDLYSKYLTNCKFVLCDGSEFLLADAFYNQKYCLTIPDNNNLESLLCSNLNEFYSLGKNYYDLGAVDNKKIDITLNEKVKFLAELI